MNQDKEKFQEQEAPLKNTDHAFVQVGSRGEPVLPKEDKQEKEPAQEEKGNQRITTIDHR